MVRKNFHGGDFNKNHKTGFSQSNRKPVEKYDNKFNPKNVPQKQSEENKIPPKTNQLRKLK